ncbi:MAG TPA: hypothetical protein VJB96_00875 [Patescibacteria group bacterium]|nr:hypothetical protein [Patescibacteria group bacterium]
MNGVEPILHEGKEIAIVYRASIEVSERLFLTENNNPFQIGLHERKKGTKIPAHLHNCPAPLSIAEIQEFLYVVKGSIRLTMLTEKKETIAVKDLAAGDSVLLKSQAHRVEFLDNARIIELKQGPYPGHEYAKTYLE